jgi:hypothetical protein
MIDYNYPNQTNIYVILIFMSLVGIPVLGGVAFSIYLGLKSKKKWIWVLANILLFVCCYFLIKRLLGFYCLMNRV